MYINRQINKYTNKCVYDACMHTYIRTYMHAYIHTYIHTCVRAYIAAAPCLLQPPPSPVSSSLDSLVFLGGEPGVLESTFDQGSG